MKNQNKCLRLCIILLLLLSASCKKYLDRYPTYTPSGETFWTSAADAQKGLTGCYAKLNTATFGGAQGSYMSLHWDGLSDNGFCQSTLFGFYNVSKGNISASDGQVLSAVWTESYAGIASCNYLLKKIEEIPGMNTMDKQRIKGEALFLRAFWYNELVMCYGAVPLITQSLGYGEENLSIKRTPVPEVVNQVLADLDSAIAWLPDVKYTDGHVVKGTALGFKARVALYHGKYDMAAAAAKQVIDSKVFSLHNNYNGIFFNQQANNPEIMFSVRYEAPLNYTNLDLVYGSRFAVCVHADLVNAYECTDGKLPAESAVFDPANPYLHRDPRLKNTVFTKGDPWAYDRELGFGYRQNKAESLPQTGFGLRKYVNYDINPDARYDSEQDFIKLRYADVLLMYAEAKTELNQVDQSVLDAINQVKARAYGAAYTETGKYPAVTATGQAELRTLVRRERRVELAFEGLRYYDLKRWRIAHTVLPQLKDPDNKPRQFDPEKHYLWPIPESEMQIMGPGFGQNPNY